jgi:DNA-directed RNA polymerase specialized sigma24 family protein
LTWEDFIKASSQRGLDEQAISLSILKSANQYIRNHNLSVIRTSDIVSESFVRLYRAITNDTLDPLHPRLVHLLGTMVKQAAIDLYRRQKASVRGGHLKRVPLEENLAVWEESGRSVWEDSGRSEEELKDFLEANLSRAEMELLERIAEGDRLREIAIQFDVSRSEAGRKAMALRAKLRKMFPDKFGDPFEEPK